MINYIDKQDKEANNLHIIFLVHKNRFVNIIRKSIECKCYVITVVYTFY